MMMLRRLAIVSIALAHDAVVVTRDQDFTNIARNILPLGMKLHLFNPFDPLH